MEQGLVVVPGPTGSGKSTTLAAMIDYINSTMAKHIITIEDPIEFVHPVKKSVIVHREVGKHTASFAAALKGAMRHDPDILLLGEMREMETIKLALGWASNSLMARVKDGTITAKEACMKAAPKADVRTPPPARRSRRRALSRIRKPVPTKEAPCYCSRPSVRRSSVSARRNATSAR